MSARLAQLSSPRKRGRQQRIFARNEDNNNGKASKFFAQAFPLPRRILFFAAGTFSVSLASGEARGDGAPEGATIP
jgi:hypothetical protein